MKIAMAIEELHRSESKLARRLRAASARHRAEHEIHHVALDLAQWSDEHVRGLADIGARHGLSLSTGVGHLDVRHAADVVQQGIGTALGRRPEIGVVLLADLRRLHRTAAGVSMDWELLAQGAQAIRDEELPSLATSAHPDTLRQMRWANAMLKTLSPQVLAS